jgi:hypothetical protein
VKYPGEDSELRLIERALKPAFSVCLSIGIIDG